jgi:hypothetical protein
MTVLEVRAAYRAFVSRQQLGPDWSISDQTLLELTLVILDEIIAGKHSR